MGYPALTWINLQVGSWHFLGPNHKRCIPGPYCPVDGSEILGRRQFLSRFKKTLQVLQDFWTINSIIDDLVMCLAFFQPLLVPTKSQQSHDAEKFTPGSGRSEAVRMVSSLDRLMNMWATITAERHVVHIIKTIKTHQWHSIILIG